MYVCTHACTYVCMGVLGSLGNGPVTSSTSPSGICYSGCCCCISSGQVSSLVYVGEAGYDGGHDVVSEGYSLGCRPRAKHPINEIDP